MNDKYSERKILLKLFERETNEKIKKAIFIDVLKKSKKPKEREECFKKLDVFRTKKIKDIQDFIKDVFLHDGDRIKREEDEQKNILGWYINKFQEILGDSHQNIAFLVGLVYTYFIKITHQDRNYLTKELKKSSYGLPAKVRNGIIKKLKEKVIRKSIQKRRKPVTSFRGFFDSLLEVDLPCFEKETSFFCECSHDQLCKAFKKYLEDSKSKFLKDFTVEFLHGLNDKGVDLLIVYQKKIRDFQKFGIQVKSYGDIKDKDFSKIVKSNISESKQHGLIKFYIAFCGDLTSPSQSRKIRMISSEISQMNYPYVKVMSSIDCCGILRKYLVSFKKGESIVDETKAKKIDNSLIIKNWKEFLSEIIRDKKGKALEKIVAILMESIFGVGKITTRRRTKTEEIDIVIRNELNDEFWKKQGSIVLVECKNWTKETGKIGKNEIVLFRDKIANRYGRCKLGFLISLNGFKKTITMDMLRSSKTDLLIVPVEKSGLQKLVFVSSGKRNELLKGFTEKAIMT